MDTAQQHYDDLQRLLAPRRALQPPDVAKRFAYDADYGAFADHPADPRQDDDDTPTEADCRDEATDQILSCAESVADWLAKACDTDAGRMPIDVRSREPMQIIEGAAPLLLAVIMNGNNTQALRAMYRLRALAAAHFEAQIDERTAALMSEAA